MSTAGYIFTGSKELAESGEGQPDTKNQKLFYRVMMTSIEPLYGILNEGESISLIDICQNENYTSMTLSFPNEFVSCLSEIQLSDHDRIIEQWMKDEDCPYDNEKDMRDLLSTLIGFSKLSIESNELLLLRIEM